MQFWCSQRLPLQSYFQRVIGEYRFLIVVALIQADALATSKVYCRDYVYRRFTSLFSVL
jgi:hypothetical protein